MQSSFSIEALESRQLLTAGYSIVDLNPQVAAAGFRTATVTAIAPSGGWIIGEASDAHAAESPIVWTSHRFGRWRLTVLPSPGAGAARVAAINSSGEIVGNFSLTTALNSTVHACRWILDSAGRYVATDLGTLPGAPPTYTSFAMGVNAAGVIVGRVNRIEDTTDDFGLPDAVVWSVAKHGQVDATVLSTSLRAQSPGPLAEFSAAGVDDAGDIFGSGSDGQPTAPVTTAYLWRVGAGGKVKTQAPIGIGSVTAVSTGGSVAIDEESSPNSVLLRPVGHGRFASTVLDPGSAGSQSEVLGFSPEGVAVGKFETGSPAAATACVFSDSAPLVHRLLDDLPPQSSWSSLESANGIDEAGEIVGDGTFGSGQPHPFLLVAAAG